ncbi:TonB-dependent receptor plug domain-containing protein [Reichenbachiella versicolor]|uniref:TonB-dependent receptor plug domain-containing protein n=1 Tax=Reichenbachiella versicolor TaxID=1821036 RepID=UPI0013A5697E|nr:TonB-dependent receptor [Reichenbachiella versicolor]
MKRLYFPLIVIVCLLGYHLSSFAQNRSKEVSQIYEYNLKELAQIKVTTGSIEKEIAKECPSNVMIFTKQMIDERGYLTLVDLCQDVPGFDFMVYNDGAGEHSTYNMNRGLGTIGNPNILIMIDGIIQNNISFNWSLLWTYENTFVDVERIEVVQGPGSVLYGAQAVTGVINIITKKDFEGSDIRTAFGTNFTRINDIYLGTSLKNDFNFSIAVHTYNTKGDKGIGRYDPGGYFNDHIYPTSLTEHYNAQGDYVTNVANPKAGKPIPNGFNTLNDSYAIRFKLNKARNEIGVFYSYYNRAYGSSTAAYEYDLTASELRSSFQSYHGYYKNTSNLSDRIELNSDLVFRSTNVLPETGLRYNYRFYDLTKGYASKSFQGYIEEKLTYETNNQSKLYFGIKASFSKKSESIVSLGPYSIDNNTTSSSWDIADSGDGLMQSKHYPTFNVWELASYLLYDLEINSEITSSIGLRYDYSTEFGHILNPRAAIVYHPSTKKFGGKLMYGSAFRQPGIFELSSEFRGNSELTPEKIGTTELELNSSLINDKLFIKTTAYYSIISNFIGKVPDSTMPAGERFENLPKMYVGGITGQIGIQATSNTLINANYNYITGIDSDANFFEIERSAKHKMNAGFNQKLLEKKLTIDFRMNWVGKRKAQSTNIWLNTYENGYAPSYTKFNLTTGYQINKNFLFQLIVFNLTNTKYYGIGRETGSGFVDDYDYQTNIDPDGFIPSYHPQPGRSFLARLIFKT